MGCQLHKTIIGGRVKFKAGLSLAILILFGCNNNQPQNNANPISVTAKVSQEWPTSQELVQLGKKVIFGTDDPEGELARGKNPVGRGQCPLCHQFFPNQKADRAPSFLALPEAVKLMEEDEGFDMPMEARSHIRIKEDRYKEFASYFVNGEPYSGIKPHAKTGGEYIIESHYCPSCYTSIGFGWNGTDDRVSLMPTMHLPPVELTDMEIVAAASYIQFQYGSRTFSKVTAKESWESYFGRKLGEPSVLLQRKRHLFKGASGF